MSLDELWSWIQDSELSFQIGATYWFPLLESIHVLAVVLLVGSIMMVDLRLLGATATRYAVSTFHRELTYWSWIAFVVALLSGAGLFISRPAAYAENPAFQIKFILLLLAGLNLALFRKFTYVTVADWDALSATPPMAKLAGASSLLIWAGAILAGRWVGHIM